MRRLFLQVSFLILAVNLFSYFYLPQVLWSMLLFGPLILLGLRDITQKSHSILRNYPVLGHMRFLLEEIRPEMYQYFVESDTSGRPFSREQRSVVYARAKNTRDTVPFGTVENVYETGYEWVNHSLSPKHMERSDVRVLIGGPECKQSYSASLLNISAMSYGALSKNAVIALNQGAKIGGFAHNTGEGGLSPYHLQGGDLIWQVGTGYFGCRNEEGRFCPETFAKRAAAEEVKMIEIKLSQGAKPGHGGILPATKLTEEIAKIRDVPMGHDVNSPPGHTAFSNPLELVEFIKELRELSGGKPIGFKLCVGKRREFLSICKAMHETGISPDFITVDGGEGGTGAAPMEFSNHIGTPLVEGLIFVHNSLVGFNLREKIKIISGGKLTSGFGLVKRLALGADLCYSARAMMMALGCIQARKCNSNVCPVGVTTQNPNLMGALVPADKSLRVNSYHRNTVVSACEIMGAMGLESAQELKPWHLMRRIEAYEIRNLSEIYEYIEEGSLLKDSKPESYARACEAARSDSFTMTN
ncbi:MAG: FMN-binding glutamate synthase family protein [SAR324 cluster bacterium]|nr:FMN-binding glutamate synthase family protein [SAR324 cluster bacterium]MBL7035177.1 FMN-binding glutamate synthase family protein [SAR324 cluster bacterium]